MFGLIITCAAALSFISGSRDKVSALLIRDENSENSTSCDTDRDCPETMFCYTEMCYPCFDCAKIFRQNWLRCAREPSDCGKCLEGYQEDSYKTSHYHWCREDVSIAEPHKTENPDHREFEFNLQWLGLFVVACFFVLGLASYYCYNSRQRPVPRSSSWTTNVVPHYQLTNPPPPYKEDDLPIGLNDPSSIPCSFHLEVSGNSEEDQQKALPFIYTENLRTGNCDHTTSINSVPGEVAFAAVNIDIHDENTVPSSWTPGASYGETATEFRSEDESPPKKRKRSSDNEIKIEDDKYVEKKN